MAHEPGQVIFASSREAGKIPVIALLGRPGSGKTYFLNQLLSTQCLPNTVVLSASDDALTAHQAPRLQKLAPLRVSEVSDSGCFCCGMRSGLGDALRDLFLRALKKSIPPVERVLIEANITDPGPLKFTLRHAPFLGQRYIFDKTILLIEDKNLPQHPIDLRESGIEHADYVICSNAPKLSKDRLKEMELAVKQLNSKAKLVLSIDKLETMLFNKLH